MSTIVELRSIIRLARREDEINQTLRMGLRMRLMTSVLIIVAAMIAGPARAEFVTGNQLYEKCNSNAPEDKFWCLGFVTGSLITLPQGPKEIVCQGRMSLPVSFMM
jgi:hypothetical protein